jgi:hypothetical protein
VSFRRSRGLERPQSCKRQSLEAASATPLARQNRDDRKILGRVGASQSRLWVNSGCAGQAAARQVNPNKRTPELEQTYLAIRHPRSTVTDAVKQLEARLGVRLLQRTTRHVSPTLDGEAYQRLG